MVEAGYDRVGGDAIQLEDRSPSRQSEESLDDTDSDVSYRDNLEDEPFNEKDRRFQHEPHMEDGEGEGYPVEPRRVSGWGRSGIA